MSQEIIDLIGICKRMISCKDCERICSAELPLECGHLICENCYSRHTCTLPKTAKSIHTPSLAFLRDLYSQLANISTVYQKCGTVLKAEDEMKSHRKRFKHQSNIRKSPSPGPLLESHNVSCEEIQQEPVKDLNGDAPSLTKNCLKKEETLVSNSLRFGVAQIDDLVTRYLPSRQVDQNKQRSSSSKTDSLHVVKSNNDMPKLERQDKFKQHLDSLPGTRHRENDDSNPAPLLAFGVYNTTNNEEATKFYINGKKSCLEKRNSLINPYSPTKKLPDLRCGTVRKANMDRKLILGNEFSGFTDSEYHNSVMSLLHWRLFCNQSSLEKHLHSGFEISIKRINPSPSASSGNKIVNSPLLPSGALNNHTHSQQSGTKRCRVSSSSAEHKDVLSSSLEDQNPSEKGIPEELKNILFREKENTNLDSRDGVSFATAGLTFQEETSVAKLARMTKAKLTNYFSHETTHLILNENSIGSQEYLFAIVYGAFIVTFDWVLLCLEEKKILSPMGFIPKTEEGPCRCLETTYKPFQGYYFFMGMSPQPSHLDYDAYQVTKTLCYNGGAHIILDLEKFAPFIMMEDVNPRFYICVSMTLTDLVDATCRKLKAIPIKHSWISDSVRQYRALPIEEYLFCPIGSAELLNEYHVPKELLSADSL